MDEEALDRFIPEHPLPKEIQDMQKDDTVCQFCGVSYLIHNEMKALEERVKEAERQMEYYKGSVEREEKLKVKVKCMEEESDKLSRTLQASEERTKIFLSEMKLKDEQLNNLQQEKDELEEKMNKILEENEKIKKNIMQFKEIFGDVPKQLISYRKELDNLKSMVKNHYKGVLNYSQGVNVSVAEVCEKFNQDYEDLKQTLDKYKTENESFASSLKQLQNKLISAETEVSKFKEVDKKANELKRKCESLENQLKTCQEKITTLGDHNKEQNSKISDYEETLLSKEKETKDLLQKLQQNEETSKNQKQNLQEIILNKEKELYNKEKECKTLKNQVEELGQRGNETKAIASSSQDEIKSLKDLLTSKNNEILALQSEREKMIVAHHNRIEQLRESFKKKMEEADAWPLKFEKAIQELEQKAKMEKDDMWKDLNESFQKEMQEQQEHHTSELNMWKNEAKTMQDKFKKDVDDLNVKHREQVRRLQSAAKDEKTQSSKIKESGSAIIANLEDKVRDLEARLRQRSTSSSEEVASLQARVHELHNIMNDADHHIKQLETELSSTKEQNLLLQDTVRQECEERLELTDALSDARTKLLSLQRQNKISLSRTSLSTSGSSHSLTGSTRDDINSTSSTCLVGFDGVNIKSSQDSGRLSRSGSVDDSRKRIAAALGRSGSKSRLGDNSSREYKHEHLARRSYRARDCYALFENVIRVGVKSS